VHVIFVSYRRSDSPDATGRIYDRDTHLSTNFNAWFDVSKDGRFLIPTQAEQAAPVPTVVINWTAGLKK
jgi:hypothetical protein